MQCTIIAINEGTGYVTHAATTPAASQEEPSDMFSQV